MFQIIAKSAKNMPNDKNPDNSLDGKKFHNGYEMQYITIKIKYTRCPS